MRKLFLFVVTAGGMVLSPAVSHAQSITPQIGVYVPGNSFESVRAGADSVSVAKEGTLALGLNLEFGWLRGSLAYASAAKLNRSGTSGDVGTGKLLAVAGDVVLRPIPRLLVVQPYLIGGAGLRRADYDYKSDGLTNAFPKSDSDFALHAGVGADVMLGPIGVAAEITDFISKNTENKWNNHDAFGFVGVRLKF